MRKQVISITLFAPPKLSLKAVTSALRMLTKGEVFISSEMASIEKNGKDYIVTPDSHSAYEMDGQSRVA